MDQWLFKGNTKLKGIPVIVSCVRILIAVYFGLGLYLFVMQRNFIYFPVATAKAEGVDEQTFEHQGHQLKVTILNPGKSKALLYFGGNAEAVDLNAKDFSEWFTEYTVYLVKYRGYGGSTGKPTEDALYSDALFVFGQINGLYDTVAVMGRSLGSAVATYVASEETVEKLILVTPFDSVQRIAQSQFPLYPMSILLKDKHDSYTRAKSIRVATLVIAAEHDEIIASKHTQRLVSAFQTQVQFSVIEGAGHNDISLFSDYGRLIKSFLQDG